MLLLSVGVPEHGMINASIEHQTSNLRVGSSNLSGRARKVREIHHFSRLAPLLSSLRGHAGGTERSFNQPISASDLKLVPAIFVSG